MEPLEVSFYRESPFERIVDVHWKKKDDSDGGGLPPFPYRCGAYTFTPADFHEPGIFIGVDVIYVGLGAIGHPNMDGTYIYPRDMPPIDWSQIGPPEWNYTQKDQIYIQGNYASSVFITVDFPGPQKYWLRPNTAWTDRSIWTSGIGSMPAGPPTGEGTFSEVIEATKFDPTGNPNNFGTTIQLWQDPTTEGSVVVTVEHNCPSNALPAEVVLPGEEGPHNGPVTG